MRTNCPVTESTSSTVFYTRVPCYVPVTEVCSLYLGMSTGLTPGPEGDKQRRKAGRPRKESVEKLPVEGTEFARSD